MILEYISFEYILRNNLRVKKSIFLGFHLFHWNSLSYSIYPNNNIILKVKITKERQKWQNWSQSAFPRLALTWYEILDEPLHCSVLHFSNSFIFTAVSWEVSHHLQSNTPELLNTEEDRDTAWKTKTYFLIFRWGFFDSVITGVGSASCVLLSSHVQ